MVGGGAAEEEEEEERRSKWGSGCGQIAGLLCQTVENVGDSGPGESS